MTQLLTAGVVQMDRRCFEEMAKERDTKSQAARRRLFQDRMSTLMQHSEIQHAFLKLSDFEANF